MEEQPKKVLVLEKDRVVLVLISHVLKRESYEVHSTSEPDHAAELAASNDYAAYLISLADGGIDLVHEIAQRRQEAASRIIGVTTELHGPPPLNGLSIHSVLKKPVEIYNLIETVANCAGQGA